MFSKNNKISKRQMFRLLTYDLLGVGTLLLPSALGEYTGKNGMLAIGAGAGAGVAYSFLLGWLISSMEEGEGYPAFLKRCFGTVLGSAFLLFYVVYYLLLGGYVSYVFGHLIVIDLLKEQSFYWITAGIVAIAVYAILQGIEGRARIYEIVFWFLMAPLFFMLFLAARDVEVPRLFPLYAQDARGIFTGSYLTFSVFSLGGFALFLVPFAKKKDSIRGALTGASLFCGVTILALYGILQGLFGVAGMKGMEYPAVAMMSMVQIPGGFFQRQDALMVAIWFFTVFALLGSSMFYASENLTALTGGKGKGFWIFLTALAFFGISVLCYRSMDVTELLQRLFLQYATPAVAVIPLLAGICIRLRGKGRAAAQCIVLLCGAALLSGCSTQELENRKFPLAMGVDRQEDACRVSYKFQDLSKIADEKAEGSPGGTDFYIEDEDFYTAVSKYANQTNKILDYNHMKALILSVDFVEDAEALSNFIWICEKENLIARNTLLFFSEDAAEILLLDKKLDASIGSYLEEMMDSREDYKLKDAATFGDLCNEMWNREQLLLIPVLAESGGVPVIRSYYALSGGAPKGEVEVNEAVLSYLSQGKIKKLSFSLEDGTAILINRIRVRGKFLNDGGLIYRNKIHLEAVVEKEMDTGGDNGEAVRRQIKELFERQLNEGARRLKDAPGIDMNNCFYKLGMSGGESLRRYRGDLAGFLSDLEVRYEVDVILCSQS